MKRRRGASSGKRGGGEGPSKHRQSKIDTSPTTPDSKESAWWYCTLIVLLFLVAFSAFYVAFVPNDFRKGHQLSRSERKGGSECTNCRDKSSSADSVDTSWMSKDEEKALEELEEIYINSGLNCQQLMDGAKAILDKRPKEEWEHALDLLATCALQEPENASPRWNLAVVLDQLGREEEALNFLDEAIDLDPYNVEYLKTGGAMLSRKGYHAEAIRCLERFLARSLRVPRWDELLASISIQREDEWSFLFEIDEIIHVLELLQTSYLSEKKLIKAGYLYKVLIGLKGDNVELELLAAYSFFAFGLGDCSTGIHYLRLYTEKQYVMQGYGNVGQAYDVVTAHALRLFTAGFDSNIVNIGKNLLMAGDIVWDELEFHCELTRDDYFNYSKVVKQSDLRKTFIRCIQVQNIVSQLLDDGAAIYAENIFGWTPLLHSSALGSSDIVKLLLKHHADAQARTVIAHTSLHVAAFRGSYEVVEPLVQGGLKVTEKDYFNRTAMDIACLHRWSANGMAKVLHTRLPHLCPSPVLYSPAPKLSPQGGWLNSGVPLPLQLTKERCDFDVMSETDIDQFVFDYLSLQRPVLVRNATNSHILKKVYQSWQRNKFEQEFGKLTFTEVEIPYAESFGYSSSKETTIKAFMAKLKNLHFEAKELGRIDYLHNTNPTYIFETVKPQSPLLANFKPPDILDPDLTHISTMKTQFYLGPPLSGAPVHFHRNAWNVLIYGEKRWFVYPPDRAFYSKQHVWEWWRETYKNRPDALECVQHPGDMVFIPDMWGHGVINLRESVGVASEFVYGASEFSI